MTGMLRHLLARPTAPAVLLERAATTVADTNERLAVLLHPATPAHARDQVLRHLLHSDDDVNPALTTAFTGGADLPTVLRDALPHLGSMTLLPMLRLVTTLVPHLRDVVDDTLLTGTRRSPNAHAWVYLWTHLAMDVTRPDTTRRAAVLAAASHTTLPSEMEQKLISLALTDTADARRISHARPADAIGALARAASEPLTSEAELAHLATEFTRAGNHHTAVQNLAHLGTARTQVVATTAANAPATHTIPLTAIATYDAFTWEHRETAARELLTRYADKPIAGIVLARVVDQALDAVTRDPRCPTDMVIAHERGKSTPWVGLTTLLDRCPPAVTYAAWDDLRAGRCALTPARVMALATHPHLTVHERRDATALLDDPRLADQGNITGDVRAALQHLPDTHAVAQSTTFPLARDLGWTRHNHPSPLLEAALDALLMTVTTTTQAQALLALAPTFPGTFRELFTTAGAVSD